MNNPPQLLVDSCLTVSCLDFSPFGEPVFLVCNNLCLSFTLNLCQINTIVI